MAPITPQDINKYIAMIRINFEHAYKTQDDAERQMLIKSWYAILREYPKEICDKAVIEAIKYTRSKDYAPRIGDIVERIEKMREAYEKSSEELWAELTDTFYEVSSCAYKFRFNFVESNGKTQGENARLRVEKIFNNLSPELKEYCRNSGGLVELANADGQQYEKGRFMKTIPQIKQRIKIRQSTPELATLLEGGAGLLAIEGAKDERKAD